MFVPNFKILGQVVAETSLTEIFVGKGYLFYKFYKRLQNKRVCVLIYYIGKGYFLTGESEKGYQYQNVEHTV